MPRYLVERTFPDGFRLPSDGEGARRYLDVVERNADDGVTWLHSYVSPEAIRKNAVRNQLPVDRITRVRVLDPYSYPDDRRL